jgi:hypothetical protein
VLQYVADHFPTAGLAPVCGAMAEFHRHRAAQGHLHSAARRQRACWRERLRARQGGAAARLSRQAFCRSRIPAGEIQCRRCVSRDGAELEPGERNRARRMAECADLLQAHDEAAKHRPRDRRGARALRGGDGAQEGCLGCERGFALGGGTCGNASRSFRPECFKERPFEASRSAERLRVKTSPQSEGGGALTEHPCSKQKLALHQRPARLFRPHSSSSPPAGAQGLSGQA